MPEVPVTVLESFHAALFDHLFPVLCRRHGRRPVVGNREAFEKGLPIPRHRIGFGLPAPVLLVDITRVKSLYRIHLIHPSAC
jgi:hypothetical protein